MVNYTVTLFTLYTTTTVLRCRSVRSAQVSCGSLLEPGVWVIVRFFFKLEVVGLLGVTLTLTLDLSGEWQRLRALQSSLRWKWFSTIGLAVG